MALIYFWTGDKYRADVGLGLDWHLNQDSEMLHNIKCGENLWAFTRRDERGQDKAYVLVAKFVVTRKTKNPKNNKGYGLYRVWGDPLKSHFFSCEDQADFSDVLKSLSIKLKGNPLGRSFRGGSAVRFIDDEDDKKLENYSKKLTDKISETFSDEQLEQALMLGDAALEVVLAGLDRTKELDLRARIRRNRELVLLLRDKYQGRCQICEWSPRDEFEEDLCEGHHINWLGRGGVDDISNMVLLCPNHHRAVHRLNAEFDWERQIFFIGEKENPLGLNFHNLEI
ncbi:MAG: HNH endonuclease [Limnohabitans sp.]